MLLRHFVITSFFKINVITSFCYYVVFKCYYVITRGTRARREKRLKPTGGKIYTVKSTRRLAAKSGAWKCPYIGGLVLLESLFIQLSYGGQLVKFWKMAAELCLFT